MPTRMPGGGMGTAWGRHAPGVLAHTACHGLPEPRHMRQTTVDCGGLRSCRARPDDDDDGRPQG
jgi:hypothetical protein